MYSQRARKRAVRLYIRYRGAAVTTIRELGYPSGTQLRRWYREFVESGDLHQGYQGAYTDEQKQWAVEHFCRHGRSISKTIAELGYPKPDTLMRWIDELRPGTRKVYNKRGPRVPLSEEQKRRAVIELCSGEHSAAAITRQLGVSRYLLYGWKNELLGEEVAGVMAKKSRHSLSEERDELMREVESLRKRIHQLQLEHDILKKTNELLPLVMSRAIFCCPSEA